MPKVLKGIRRREDETSKPVRPVEKSWVWLGSVISSVIESKDNLDDPPIIEPIIDLRRERIKYGTVGMC